MLSRVIYNRESSHRCMYCHLWVVERNADLKWRYSWLPGAEILTPLCLEHILAAIDASVKVKENLEKFLFSVTYSQLLLISPFLIDFISTLYIEHSCFVMYRSSERVTKYCILFFKFYFNFLGNIEKHYEKAGRNWKYFKTPLGILFLPPRRSTSI